MSHASTATFLLLLLLQSLTSTAYSLPSRNRTHLQLPNFLPAHCIRLTNPPPPGLKPTNCESLAALECSSIHDLGPARLRRNQWVWNEVEDCAIGVYFPETATPPTESKCLQVLGQIIDRCAMRSQYNAGAVNVDVWPDFEQEGTPIEEGEVRWVLAPWRLSL